VVFSFFRKDKQPDDGGKPVTVAKPVPKPAAADAKAQPAAPGPNGDEFGDFGPAGGIEVIESTTESTSAVEEAAIYYANNLVDQASATLLHAIHDPLESRDIQPWLMLFDLYQLSGMKQPFEDLALEFVVKFERSAPVWMDTQQAAEPKPAARTESGNYFAFTGPLSAASAAQFQQLQAVAGKSGSIRLDLSKVQGVDGAGSKLLLEALQGLARAGVRIQYSGAGVLTEKVREAVKAGGNDAARNHWLLLLELYQLQGKLAEFEDLAVEYAVTFEVSPPSWVEMPGAAPVEEGSLPPEQAGERAAAADSFPLKGVICGTCEQRMKALVQYAAARPEVRIDMSGVSRVEFVSVGMVLNTMIELNSGGKRVLIEGANEMVSALLGVMGVGQFATIVRKGR
jgi:anti-anti-sigma regulatory factor